MIDEKKDSHQAKSFTITINCPTGDLSSQQIITKSDWPGQCVVCPRYFIPNAKNKPEYKFENPGVYVLVGDSDEDNDEDDLQTIYVGEADPVGDRLLQHCAGDKDFWKWCIFFVGDHLNVAHIEYLEASLIKRANPKKAKLSNKNEPSCPTLSFPEKENTDGFLNEILRIFSLVGLSAFEEVEPPENFWYINIDAKRIHATGYKDYDKFVVLKGSTAAIFGAAHIPPGINKCKKNLTKKGILVAKDDHWEFTQDYAFRTPAKAAGVILGKSAAKSAWLDKNGSPMKNPQNGKTDKMIIDSEGS